MCRCAPVITLVLGGARSGKSAVAQRLVAGLPAPVTYIATATANDHDFAARIERHRVRRPSEWKMIEAGAELVPTVRRTKGTVLVDALGPWVAAHDSFAVETDSHIDVLSRRQGDTVIVSEEVGLGVHPSTEVGRAFRDVLGESRHGRQRLALRGLVVGGRVWPTPQQ